MNITNEDIEAFKNMNRKYIFDVDGTLTPSRGKIDPEFLEFFNEFIKENKVYLATGSDAPKTIEQIGQDLFNSVERVYNCSGNSVWENGINIYNNDWVLAKVPQLFLDRELFQSEFTTRTGNHFDARPGLMNFSVVGRGATTEQREEYVKYDTETKERWTIAKKFNDNFMVSEKVVAQVAGETGLDIMPVGKGKQQIIKDFNDLDEIIFIGDKTMHGGNDYDISEAVKLLVNGKSYQVQSYKDTWEILKGKENV
jgi:phosphomannomutase